MTAKDKEKLKIAKITIRKVKDDLVVLDPENFRARADILNKEFYEAGKGEKDKANTPDNEAIVAAFPFAVLGFLKYNGMTAEKFIAAWVKSTFIIPKVLTFGNTNYYFAMMADGSPEAAKKCRYHRRGSRHRRKVVRKQESEKRRQVKRAENPGKKY